MHREEIGKTLAAPDRLWKQSKKATNLKNHDTIYFCVDEPNQTYKGVRGKGKMKVHENIELKH